VKERLYLKWGTLKGWDNASARTIEALNKYHAFGVSAHGVMMQHDTPEQKEALCEVIDAIDGEIISEFSGEIMTKAQAKAYVREYVTP
jgi:hypothetical protein